MFQNKKVVLIICIVALGLGGFLYLSNPSPTTYEAPKDDEVFCTADAMQCPDGSYVGRSGPKCEFDLCPMPVDAILEDGTLQ